MATPTLTIDKNFARARWASETATGASIDLSQFPHGRTVQRFGGTGTVTLEGSLDGINWFALSNTANPTAAISLATGTNTISGVLESPRFLRPVVAGGTVTIDIVGYFH